MRSIQDKIKTAYNDAFRIMFGYSRRSSASAMFNENLVSDFHTMRRMAAYSLLSRLANTTNILLTSIINSSCFLESSITKEWKNLLFNIPLN